MKGTTMAVIVAGLLAVMGVMIYVSMQSEDSPHVDEDPIVIYTLDEFIVSEELYVDGVKIEKSIDYVTYDYPYGIPGEPFYDSDYEWVQLYFTIEAVHNGMIGVPTVHTNGYINITNGIGEHLSVRVKCHYETIVDVPISPFSGEFCLYYLVPIIIGSGGLPIEEVTLKDLDITYPDNWVVA